MPRKKYKKGVPSLVYVLLIILFIPFALIAALLILLRSPIELIFYMRSPYRKALHRKYHIMITNTFEYKLYNKICGLPIEIHRGDTKFGDIYFTWENKILIKDWTQYLFLDTDENLWKGKLTDEVQTIPLNILIAEKLKENRINALPEDVILLADKEQFDDEALEAARNCPQFIVYTYDFDLPEQITNLIRKN